MPDKHKNLNSPLLAIIIVVIVLLITLDLFLKSGGRGDFAREVVRGEGILAPPLHHLFLICMHSIEMIKFNQLVYSVV